MAAIVCSLQIFQCRLTANPEKAHTKDDPRASTASGMPRAMATHTARVAQGAAHALANTNLEPVSGDLIDCTDIEAEDTATREDE